MIIICLAAGLGSRLSPHTDNKPKCMLEYNGLPVTARKIAGMIRNYVTHGNVTPLTRRTAAEELSA